MALFEDGLLGGIAKEVGALDLGILAIALGVVVLGPALFSAAGRAARPLAKGAIKTGMRISNKGRVLAAATAEKVGDIVAESKAKFWGLEDRPEGADQEQVSETGDGSGEGQTGFRGKPWIVRGW